MRWSKSHLFTLKDAPNDAEIPSHKLMVRAGMIKKVAPGIYTYGNLALRAIRKFERIVREELNKRGAQEVLMPMVQPAELWQETNRWKEMGDGLLLRGIHVAGPARNFDAAIGNSTRAIRGAAPWKADEGAFYVEQYGDQRHNREQGTENDQDDLCFHLC